MRNIKFRAWDKESKVMRYNAEQAYNGCYQMNDVQYFGQLINNNKYKLMQYSGCKDINGIEIYEGDIVHLFGYGEYEGIDYNGLVIFKDGAFCVIDGLEDNYSFARYDFNKCGIEVTVIGNIYDNSELLEVN